MTLTIHTQWMPKAEMVIRPEGAIRSDNAFLLRDRVTAVLAATKPREIVVDLNSVPSIDEAGLGALVSGHDAAVAREATLVVADPRPDVYQQIRTHGLSGLLASSD